MAIETLRPNAAGDLAQFTPNAGANFQCVDEAVADGDTTYVEQAAAAQEEYNYLYIRIKENGVMTQAYKGEISSQSWVSYNHAWTTRPSDSQPWDIATLNALQIGYRSFIPGIDYTDLHNLPATSIPVGSTINSVTVYAVVRNRQLGTTEYLRVTQNYVIIDYTPLFQHIAKVKSVAVTSIAKIGGVAVASIAKVGGVAV